MMHVVSYRRAGEEEEQAFCERNFLSPSSLRMSAEARVSCVAGRRGYSFDVVFIICLQEQLKQVLIESSFPEGLFIVCFFLLPS